MLYHLDFNYVPLKIKINNNNNILLAFEQSRL